MRNPLIPCALLILPAHAGDSQSPIVTPPPSDGWEWSISAGAAHRRVGEITSYAGYRSSSAMIPSFVGGESMTMPPVGDPDAPADRTYDDGYVRRDRHGRLHVVLGLRPGRPGAG